MSTPASPNADRFAPLPPDKASIWEGFAKWEEVYFPTLVGIEVEEIRSDYARMRLPHRTELNQPIGVVHGGALGHLYDAIEPPGWSRRSAATTRPCRTWSPSP